jgi:hypothetical protein
MKYIHIVFSFLIIILYGQWIAAQSQNEFLVKKVDLKDVPADKLKFIY